MPPKKYTTEELAALVTQLHDAKGTKLSVMSSTDLSGTMEQSKALLSSMTVEPAECQEMAAAGTAQSVSGASMALGTSIDAAVGASTTVSLISGLDPAFLEKNLAQADKLSKCANMSMTISGTKIDVTLTKENGVGAVPETIAYKTDSTLPDGRKQSVITAQALRGDVLISVIALGGKSEEDAVSRAGSLLDQAAALVK